MSSILSAAQRFFAAEDGPTRHIGYEVIAPGDSHWDALAGEALATDRLERGLCC